MKKNLMIEIEVKVNKKNFCKELKKLKKEIKNKNIILTKKDIQKKCNEILNRNITVKKI